MKILKTKSFPLICLLFLSTSNCEAREIVDSDAPPGPSELSEISEFHELSKHYDRESNTYYYLTHIKHQDKNEKSIKLRHAYASKETGETVREFAQRIGCTLAFNASTQRVVTNGIRPNGVQIIDGEITQDIQTTAYALGIKSNNFLVAYEPGVSATDILKDGVNNALTAFGPLIENYLSVPDEVLQIRGNYAVKHPRQVIAQLHNLDILFLSCGGRGFDGDGMTAKDVVRILLKRGVRFAYMLDGGGSTSTVINGELITKKIDENGTKERPRPNFLYVE